MSLGTLPAGIVRSGGGRSTLSAARVSAAVVGVVVAVWLLTLIWTGSPVGDVLRWVGAVLVGVLAPGFVLVRACRWATAPLVEDLAWAAPAGALVALTGWLLDRVLPLSPAPYVVGPVVVALGLAVPCLRRRVLARPAPGWGRAPSLVLGGVLLVATAWMVATGLRAYRPDPGSGGTLYYPDVLYQLDLLGELRHSLVPSYPPVAGTALSYHWFLYAITAHLTTGTGVDGFDATLRLAPATLVPGILVLTAVVARRLCGRVWAGPLAAVLLGVVGISEATRRTTEDGSIGVLPRIWRASPPQTLGWLASLAAAGALIALLRHSRDDRAVPVALLVPFLVLTAGSKSSELPVLIAGVALAAGIQLLRRDWPTFRRCLAGLSLQLGVLAAATVTIYGSNTYGVHPEAWGVVVGRVPSMFPTPHAATPLVPELMLGTASALFLVPLLPRLLGLVLGVRYRFGDPAAWMCLGTAVAGLAVPFVVRHPSGSEIYFLLSAYPVGVLGAASGLVLAAERVRAKLAPAQLRRYAGLLAVLVALGAVSAAVVAFAQGSSTPFQQWQRTHPGQRTASGRPEAWLAWLWWRPTLTLALVLAVVAVVAAVLIRRGWPVPRAETSPNSPTGPGGGAAVRHRRAPTVAVAVLSLLLGTGLFATGLQFHGTQTPVQGSVAAVHPPAAVLARAGLLPTMRDTVAAGHWVDRHAGPRDVVATNMYCRHTRAKQAAHEAGCDARNFTASAFTQRRTLVGGWAYADRVLGEAWTLNTSYREAPFWDRALLDEQYDAVARPTAALLASLYRAHRVRWLFVDLRDGPVDVAALDRLAVPRFRGPSTAVWQLRTPGRAVQR